MSLSQKKVKVKLCNTPSSKISECKYKLSKSVMLWDEEYLIGVWWWWWLMMYYCPCIILCFIHILVIMCFCRRFKKSLASLIATFRKRLLACIFTKNWSSSRRCCEIKLLCWLIANALTPQLEYHSFINHILCLNIISMIKDFTKKQKWLVVTFDNLFCFKLAISK